MTTTTTLCTTCGSTATAGQGNCGACGALLPPREPGAATTAPAPGPMVAPVVRVGDVRSSGGAPAGRFPQAVRREPQGLVGVGLGRRVLAVVIDAGAVGFVIWCAFALMILSASSTVAGVRVLGLGQILLVMCVSLLSWGALAFIEGTTGRTLGNMAISAQTVDAESRGPIGFWRALGRWFLLGLAGIVPIVGPVLVVISPAFDSSPARRGWHDKATRSAVVPFVAAGETSGATDQLRAAMLPGASQAPYPASVAAHPAPDPAPTHPAPAPAPLESAATPPVAPVTPTPAQAPVPAPVPRQSSEPIDSGRHGVAGHGAPGHGAPISSVPGFGAPVDVAAGTAMPPAPVPASPVVGEQLPDESTRLRGASAPAQPEPQVHPLPPVLELEREDGERVRVDAPALVGRNPTPDAEHALVVPILDRTVSRVHLEIGLDGGWWVRDLGSTSGTMVLTPGEDPREAPRGERVPVAEGAVLQVGDRRLTVRAASDR